jgi:hypothetical protein
LLASGEVLVVGGSGQAGDLQTLERFNPSTNLWAFGARLPRPRVAYSASILPGGLLLVVGGHADPNEPSFLNTADLYDSASDRWRPAADLPP